MAIALGRIVEYFRENRSVGGQQIPNCFLEVSLDTARVKPCFKVLLVGNLWKLSACRLSLNKASCASVRSDTSKQVPWKETGSARVVFGTSF